MILEILQFTTFCCIAIHSIKLYFIKKTPKFNIFIFGVKFRGLKVCIIK